MSRQKSTPPKPLAAGDTSVIKNAGRHICPVVGIGASAGGLAAYKAIFSVMPADSGMAFVLVPHLDPTHQSLMVELLASQTDMPVCEAKEAMAVEANHVYIIPPGKYLVIEDGKLHLSKPPQSSRVETAIDHFLRSLAVDQMERAIGIILSGTSSHGSLGLQAIKANDGMVIVQQPDTAEYSDMPQNAIDTGIVRLHSATRKNGRSVDLLCTACLCERCVASENHRRNRTRTTRSGAALVAQSTLNTIFATTAKT